MNPSREKKVLLVDDNPADLDLIREVLGRRTDCRISIAHDGEQALVFLRESKQPGSTTAPALVVLDLNLPGKDGRAVLAEVKADAQLRRIPVVVFTTSQSQHDIGRAYELGANCYVSKPGNLKDFMEVVESLEEFWLSSARLPQ
jgi:chemotaxis family two-component system response regulator Rcp1